MSDDTAEHRDHPRAPHIASATIARMESHRLPGMSIPAVEWRGLTERAEEYGTTRTDLIREAIRRVVEAQGPDAELHRELVAARVALDRTRRELDDLRAQLRSLAAGPRVAA
ncbi:MAG: hypothetical protein ACK5LS_02655 [Propioniciclava sp.]